MDLSSLSEAGSVRVTGTFDPMTASILPSPDGNYLYVSMLDGGGIAEVRIYADLSGGDVVRNLLPGTTPGVLTLNEAGNTIYSVDVAGTVRVVDVPSGTLTETLTGVLSVQKVVVAPAEDRLFLLSSKNGGEVHVLPLDGSPVRSSGQRGSDLAVSMDKAEVYVLTTGAVEVLDPVDLSFRESRPFSGTGGALAAGTISGEVHVITHEGDLLTLGDGSTPDRSFTGISRSGATWMVVVQ